MFSSPFQNSERCLSYVKYLLIICRNTSDYAVYCGDDFFNRHGHYERPRFDVSNMCTRALHLGPLKVRTMPTLRHISYPQHVYGFL